MHSRIIQISSSPIKESNYYEEDRYYLGIEDWFCREIADYVVSANRTEELSDHGWIRCFLEACGMEYNPEEQSFIIKDKELYFQETFKQFTDALEKLQDVTIQDFSGKDRDRSDIRDLDYRVWLLQNAWKDRYAFYVDGYECPSTWDGCFLNPLDEFIRYMPEGTKVYIGAVMDYHS